MGFQRLVIALRLSGGHCGASCWLVHPFPAPPPPPTGTWNAKGRCFSSFALVLHSIHLRPYLAPVDLPKSCLWKGWNLGVGASRPEVWFSTQPLCGFDKNDLGDPSNDSYLQNGQDSGASACLCREHALPPETPSPAVPGVPRGHRNGFSFQNPGL